MEVDVGLQIKRIAEALDKRLNAEAKAHGLTTAQCRVLRFLMHGEGRKITQRDVEEYLGASHVTVSGIICRMRMRGFIKVAPDPGDRRARIITLSDAKRKALLRVKDGMGEFESTAMLGLNDDERAELKRLLGKLYENVCPESKNKKHTDVTEDSNA